MRYVKFMQNTATITVDTTVPQTLQFSVQPYASSTNSGATPRQLIVESFK